MAHKTTNRISYWLRICNMTQAELARIVGVKREYINRIVNGKIQPGVGLAIKIADALGLDVETLFKLDEKGAH